MAAISVRYARSEDIPAILEIGESGWRAAYGDILADETIQQAMEQWYSTEATREAIEREDVAYFVAQRNETVVGYLSGRPGETDGVATLGAIYVDPACWDDGIGTALLDRFHQFCREHGFDTVQLHVLADNEIGISFYRSHGYECTAEQETDLFAERVRECVFEKRLG